MIPSITALAFRFAATGDACNANKGSFFGFPHWWKFLKTQIDTTGTCAPVFNFPNDTWGVGLAVIDILLYIAGIAAVLSIIIAGIGYIMAAGAPDKITAARKRIQNALIGLAIVFIASALVSFIGNALT
jgi:hypothetical protein